MKSRLYSADNYDVEIIMWELLTHLVDYEMHNYYDSSNTHYFYENDNIKNYMLQLDQLIEYVKKYPCSYLLLFRSMLLDIDQEFYCVICLFINTFIILRHIYLYLCGIYRLNHGIN